MFIARRIAFLTATLGLFLPCVGCSGSLRPGKTGQVDLGPADLIVLDMIDENEFAEVLEQKQGQVVLVDFWATWCEPCMKLFPHTVELHERFAEKGLAVIAVSLDDPDDRDSVRTFLQEQGAAFDNFISSHGIGPASFEAFAIEDGAVPHFKLYDRKGNLYRTFSSGASPLSPREIDRAIEQLLDRT